MLWGTDSIWYGSPQDQIVAFRAFQISKEFRDRFGYPEITPPSRAKVLGLNGTQVYGISAAEIKKVLARDASHSNSWLTRKIPSRTSLPTGRRRGASSSACRSSRHRARPREP